MSRNDSETWISLCQELSQGRLSRREFVLRAVTVGVQLSAIGAVLTACGKSSEKKGETAAKSGEPAAPGAGATQAQTSPAEPEKLEDELRIYNWSDYIDEATVPAFEKEFGVKVTYDTYENSDEMLAKLQAGASGYDLVFPAGYTVPALVALGLVEPINKDLIPNLKNLTSVLANPPYDAGNQHSVPWQWGLTGIAYRKDKVKAPVDSWGVFHNRDYAGKMTQSDEMRDVIGSWLKYRGYSANSTNPQELEEAKKLAIQAKALLSSYVSAPVKGQLIAGDVWIAQLWNGDTFQAKAEQPEIEFALPKEGAILWVDTAVVPKKAAHKRAAHAFLNFIYRPEISAAISNHTGYGSPNQEALAKMKNPVAFPSEEQRKVIDFQLDLGEHTALWDQIWTEIKAG